MADSTKSPGAGENSEPSVIDLTKVVEKKIVGDFKSNIIELTDMVSEDSSKEKPAIIELEKVVTPMEGPDKDAISPDVKIKKIGSEPEKTAAPAIDIEKIKDIVKEEVDAKLADSQEDEEPAIEVAVEPEQIEEAIGKIVQEKFSNDIESVIFGIMEKVIEKEIDEVKKNFQKDLDDITNVIKS